MPMFYVAVSIWVTMVSAYIIYNLSPFFKKEEPVKGTYHCPYCGSTVGMVEGDKEILDVFFVEEEGEEESLPENVISINQRPNPIFVDDDEY